MGGFYYVIFKGALSHPGEERHHLSPVGHFIEVIGNDWRS